MSKIRCFGCMEEYDSGTVCPHCGYQQDEKVKEAYYLEPGTILHAQYLMGKVLGYGGFGVTYIGYDLSLNRKVAVKEYMPSDCATRIMGETQVIVNAGDARVQFKEQLKRFIEEAKRLARFNDVDGIVDIYDCFLENNTGYIVMEYIPHPTLKKTLKREKTLPYQQAVDITKKVLTSLMKVHEEGIIHRDIAPDNIYVSDEGEVTLADFGAARFASVAHSRSLSILLKPGYAPYEQYSSKGEQGAWTDVYATAATLYRMIVGKKPPDAYDRLQVFQSENIDMLKTPGEMGIEIPVSLENALMNALQIRKEDRFQTAKSFLDALESDKVKRTVAKPIKKKHSYKWVRAAVAILAVVVCATGGYLVKSTLNSTKQVEANYMLQAGEQFVPELIGLSYEEAGAKLEDCGLLITGKRYSSSVPYNRIIEQSPKAGDIIRVGSQIEIVMSGGVQEITMPYLVSMQEDDAVKEAEGYGLSISEKQIIRDYSDLMQKGRVMEQSVEEGEKVNPQSTQVEIWVSLGKLEEETALLTVPDLLGKTKNEADQVLLDLKKEFGFTYAYGQITHENSTKVPAGQIISQSPESGMEVRTNESIEVVISDGPKMVEMPDLHYLSKSEAADKLQTAGLKAKIQNVASSSVKKGLVISQGIDAGNQVEEGTSVVVKVSSGPEVQTQTPEQTPTAPTVQTPTAPPVQTPTAPPQQTPTPSKPAEAEEGLGDWIFSN